MKTRKLFAILLSAVLLMALAIVPANAAYTTNYTDTHTFETSLGSLNKAGTNVTVNTTDKVAELASSAILCKVASSVPTAAEVELSVKRGYSTVKFTNVSWAGDCFQVKVNADGTYVIYSGNPALGTAARTVKSGTYTGNAKVAYYVDSANDRVVFSVNGEETTLNLVVGQNALTDAVIATSTTNFVVFGVFADGTSGTGAHTTISSIKTGTATYVPDSSDDDDDDDDDQGIVSDYTANFTETYKFETSSDLSAFNLAGSAVTVDTTNKVAQIPSSGNLAKVFSSVPSAVEMVLSVKRGSTTIRFTGSNWTSTCFQVTIKADGTYAVYSGNPAAGAAARTLKTGTYTGDAKVAYYTDVTNSRVVFSINGEETTLNLVIGEHALDEAIINTSVKQFVVTHIVTDATSGTGAHTTVSSFKAGTATYTGNNTGNGGNGSAPNTGDGLFAVVASIAVLAGAVVITKRKKSV